MCIRDRYKYAASALELDTLPETWGKRIERNPEELTIDILTAESIGADIAPVSYTHLLGL